MPRAKITAAGREDRNLPRVVFHEPSGEHLLFFVGQCCKLGGRKDEDRAKHQPKQNTHAHAHTNANTHT